VKILEQLRRDEGVRATPYQDSEGIATIGVGHRLDHPLCQAAIEAQLRYDVEAAEAACQAFAFWPRLSGARRGVLMNMCFNLGFAGLQGFTRMLAAIEEGDYASAAAEMRDSTWATQVGARAERLAVQMETDQWQ